MYFSSRRSSAPRLLLLVLQVLLFALGELACSSGSSSSDGTGPESFVRAGTPTLKTITVSLAASSLYVQQGTTATATGHYTGGTTQDLTSTVTWTSSDPTVASVSAAGAITALSNGTTTISAQSALVIGKATFKGLLTLTSITVTPAVVSIPASITQQFAATGHYNDGTTKNLTKVVTWSSSNNLVAPVGSAGLALATAVGLPANITASTTASAAGPISGSASLEVNPEQLSSITVTPAAKTIPAGTTQQYTATAVFPTGKYPLTLAAGWSASGGATISPTGLATANGNPGSATITATDGLFRNVSSNAARLTVVAATLQSIAITPTNPTVIAGMSLQVTATGSYAGTGVPTADLTNQVNWSSSVSTVATVSGGLVTGLAAGTTVITAMDPKTLISTTTIFTVTPAVLASITLSPTSPSAPAGTTLALDAMGTLTDGTMQDVTSFVTWTSASPTVATVSGGVVSALTQGTTQITATDPTTGVTQSESLTVTAALVSSIAITPASPSIPLGLEVPLVATATYTDGSTADVTQSAIWASSNGDIVVSNTPGASGIVTALALGISTVTATDSTTQISGQTTVTATPAILQSIALTPASASIAVGTSTSFQATGTYSDGTTQSLTLSATWASSSGAATISNAAASNGLATGTAIGTTTITATDPVTGLSGSASLTVTAPALLSITVSTSTPSVAAGLTSAFQATGTYTDGSTRDVTATTTWSATGTATVSNASGSNGVATGTALGTATITAMDPTTGLSGSATLTVTAPVLAWISVTPSAVTLILDATQPFTATGVFTDGSLQPYTQIVTWASSAPAVLSVSSVAPAGLATSIAAGSTTVTATDPTTSLFGSASVAVISPAVVTAVATGYDFACAILNGGVQCWGGNAHGELGDGTTTSSSVPVQVTGLTTGVQAISVGAFNACALVNGGVQCWGSNNEGQLGNGTTTSSSVPVQVSGLTSGVSAIATASQHACALVYGGVQCWGDNSSGDLGDSSLQVSLLPMQVRNLPAGAQSITAGGFHTCAMVNGGALCWGEGVYGEVGNGYYDEVVTSPVQVNGLTSGVQSLVAGLWNTCAIVNGGVQCWGYDFNGPLDIYYVGDMSDVPAPVAGLSAGVQAVASGEDHACAIVNGGVQCWGQNYYGYLGNGSTTPSMTPVQVAGLGSGVQSISANTQNTCALVSGAVLCWGYNAYGQLGNGTTTDSWVPVPVSAWAVQCSGNGAVQCSGNAVETCSASGTWSAAVACTNQTCISGVCTGTCAPGQTQCNGNWPTACNSAGQWENYGAECGGYCASTCPQICYNGIFDHEGYCCGGQPIFTECSGGYCYCP